MGSCLFDGYVVDAILMPLGYHISAHEYDMVMFDEYHGESPCPAEDWTTKSCFDWETAEKPRLSGIRFRSKRRAVFLAMKSTREQDGNM
jgi:hypothetical protein